MRVQEQNPREQQETRTLTALIMNKTVLARVCSVWRREGLFSSRFANIIAGWCFSHFQDHREAPKQLIQDYYDNWAQTSGDEETKKLIEKFLFQLSEDYSPSNWETNGEINPDYVVKKAGSQFNLTLGASLSEEIDRLVQRGDAAGMMDLINQFREVQIGDSSGGDLFTNHELISEIFSQERTDSLVSYGGDLGHFFGSQLCRDSLISFLGPEGSGKSWWLMDIAYRALLNRRRVAHFDMGDMTRPQIHERYMIRAAGKPYRSDNGRWPVTVEYPVELELTEKGCQIVHDFRVFEEPLTEPEAHVAADWFMRSKIKSKQPFFMSHCFPTSTATVRDIENKLRSWEILGFLPDVVIVDYADLIAPLTRKLERRDQINETWELLRALSQRLRILIVTATQANRDSYKAKQIRMEHTGEDKRKLAHVNAMFGINVTDGEKEQGSCRLNQIKRRTGSHSSRRSIHIAGCLPLANPAVLSKFRSGGKEETNE